jgi:phospholipid/cholesterol/gamma-HCH transport system permease protein
MKQKSNRKMSGNRVHSAGLEISASTENNLVMQLSGHWTLRAGLPSADQILENLENTPNLQRIGFETGSMTDWDNGLLIFLRKIWDFCVNHQITMDKDGLPKGAARLLTLATAVPKRDDAGQQPFEESWLSLIGTASLHITASSGAN